MKRVTRDVIQKRLYRLINLYRGALELEGLYSENEIYMMTVEHLEVSEEDYNNAVEMEKEEWQREILSRATQH